MQWEDIHTECRLYLLRTAIICLKPQGSSYPKSQASIWLFWFTLSNSDYTLYSTFALLTRHSILVFYDIKKAIWHLWSCRRFTVYAGPRQDVTESWWEKNCPENVTAVNNIQEFVDALVSHLSGITEFWHIYHCTFSLPKCPCPRFISWDCGLKHKGCKPNWNFWLSRLPLPSQICKSKI